MPSKLLAAALAAALSTSVAAAGPFDQFKGKMKPGLYEMKMEMEIPGMPAGMGKQAMTLQNCVAEADISEGRMGRDDKMPENCQVKNFKMSGNTASYTMVCTGDMAMTSDNTITFRGDSYTMTSRTSMKQDGQTMNMSHKMEGRYVGPCKK